MHGVLMWFSCYCISCISSSWLIILIIKHQFRILRTLMAQLQLLKPSAKFERNVSLPDITKDNF